MTGEEAKGNEAATDQAQTDKTTDIRLGIIGTGRIARRFVAESRFAGGMEIASVYNPHKGSAAGFVKELWDAEDGTPPSARRKLSRFLDDVDAVYVASPHETHFDYVMESLFRGKHVLCEKPMCLSRDEAEAAFALARSKGLVLMEGIKTAYCPGFTQMLEVLADGAIGRIRYVDACFTKLADPASREMTDVKYGGSFLELGSYVLLPMLAVFGGDYKYFGYESMTSPLGVDIFVKADFRYAGGLATLTCGLGVKSEGRLLVAGEKGYIVAEPPWWKTAHFEAHFEDPDDVKVYDCPFEGDGLRYEITHFLGRIRGEQDKADTEACSILMAGIMEKYLALRDEGRGKK